MTEQFTPFKFNGVVKSVASLVLWSSSESWSEVKDGSWPRSSRHWQKADEDMFARLLTGQTGGPVTCTLSQDGSVLEAERDTVGTSSGYIIRDLLHHIHYTVLDS